MTDKKIADISENQGTIDWPKAREEMTMAILRASIGDRMDRKYIEYAKECGVPHGAYHFVKAATAEEAIKEARFFVACANQSEQKPLFYIGDIESKAQTKDNTEEVCTAFLQELRAQGCKKIGLYINTRYTWSGAAIAMCDIMWIPHWGKNDGDIPEKQYAPKYPCDIWQYTSKGKITGIQGNVDLNVLQGSKPMEWFTASRQNETKNSNERGSPMLSNLHLATFCEEAYATGWVYWYGTCGYACTTSLYNRKKVQYPTMYTDSREKEYKADIKNGKTCSDCTGLIKAFFWKSGSISAPNVYKANNCPDKGADSMFALCTERGPIETIPDIPGLLVHKKGHIGVYVGNGYTVEMKGFAYDCVKRKVQSGPWTEWGKLPETMLVWTETPNPAETHYTLGDRELNTGCTGEDVTALQKALIAAGYSLPNYGADGKYGAETTAAVKRFQQANRLDDTGTCNNATVQAILKAADIQEDTTQDTPEGGSEPTYVLILEGEHDLLRTIQSVYGGRLAMFDNVSVQEES